MSGVEQPSEAIRKALLAAARERLRAHLAEESVVLAAEPATAGEVQKLMEQLGGAER